MGEFLGLVVAGFLIGAGAENAGAENAGAKIAAGLRAIAEEMKYTRLGRKP